MAFSMYYCVQYPYREKTLRNGCNISDDLSKNKKLQKKKKK